MSNFIDRHSTNVSDDWDVFHRGMEKTPGHGPDHRSIVREPPIRTKLTRMAAVFLVVLGTVVAVTGAGFSVASFGMCTGSGWCQATSPLSPTDVGPVYVDISWGWDPANPIAPITVNLTVCTGNQVPQGCDSPITYVGHANGSFYTWVPADAYVILTDNGATVTASGVQPGDGVPFFGVGAVLIATGLYLRKRRSTPTLEELVGDLT